MRHFARADVVTTAGQLNVHEAVQPTYGNSTSLFASTFAATNAMFAGRVHDSSDAIAFESIEEGTRCES